MTEISDNQRELETMTISFQQVMKQAQQRIIELEGVNIHGKESMLENCETSAWGRALANFGLQGDELASANELERVKAKEDAQKQKASDERVKKNFDENGKQK